MRRKSAKSAGTDENSSQIISSSIGIVLGGANCPVLIYYEQWRMRAKRDLLYWRSYKAEQSDFKIHIASEPSEGSALSKFPSLEVRQVTPSLDELPMFQVSRTVRETIAGLFVTSISEMFRRPSRSDVVWHVTSISGAPDVTLLR
jgi:hypothetical protein